MRTLARAALVVALLVTASRSNAQSATAGTPVAGTHLAAETMASVTPDGVGGAYVGFKIAYRSAALPAEIAVARITASAGRDPGWTSLPMVPAGSLPQNAPPGPSRVLRAPGGDVLVFADYSSTSAPKDIVRELAASGAAPGYPGFTPTYDYNVLNALSRSDGGALILSKAIGAGPNLLATVVAPSGAATEVLTPIDVTFGFSLGGDQIAAVPSGTGGIAVLMEPFVGGSTGVDLLAVRVDGSGNAAWTPVHRIISAAVNDQHDQVAVSAGADGVVVAWDDARSAATTPDIYAQRLLATGAIASGWVASGKAICTLTGGQALPSIASDDAGGAWIAWQDDRNTVTAGVDVYFTHILANGTFATGFPANGRALCSAAGDQLGVQLVRDGTGGVFAVWLDSRDGEQDLFAQHLNSTGNPTAGWAATGNAVCTDGTAQIGPSLGLVSTGRAIVAWNDARTGTDIVYAAAIDAVKGVLDVPRPATTRLALAAGVNPARGGVELRINAESAGDVRVTLYDVAGRVQAERALAGPMRAASVRFDGLRPGVYLARASQGGTSASTRIAVLE
jgi:hypothetical protein